MTVAGCGDRSGVVVGRRRWCCWKKGVLLAHVTHIFDSLEVSSILMPSETQASSSLPASFIFPFAVLCSSKSICHRRLLLVDIMVWTSAVSSSSSVEGVRL